MESDNYKTIKSSSEGIYKEKGSRFIAFAFPVVNQEEIKPIIERNTKGISRCKASLLCIYDWQGKD